MKPSILVDFTQNKQEIMGALNMLRVPGFSERNLFDALFDTIDRIDRIDGKKYIILVSSGADTFSKMNLDQTLKKIKSTKDVTIYAISIGWTYREMVDAASMGHDPYGRNVGWLQNDNQMTTFARMTGGRAYFPRFEGELPEIFNQISDDIRHQYTITYHPTNIKLDGTYRKIKVELQAPDGGPLKVRDQKGKDVKTVVYAREGYTAKHTVE
jgi:VWFA-related protein